MTQISLETPEIGKPDKTEDQKIITCFTTIQTAINGNLDSTNLKPASITGESIAAPVTGLRLIASERGIIGGSKAAGTYFFAGANAMSPATAGTVAFMPNAIFLRPSEYEVPTKNTKLALQYEVQSNAAAPGATFLFYLIKLSALGGGTGEITSTWAGVVAGSEDLLTPVASTAEFSPATAIAIPAEGTYTVAVNTVGTTAAASYNQLAYRMYVKNE